MAQNKKPLLQEGTIRRMMKLANMDALGDGFITEKYTPLEEEAVDLKERGSKQREYKRRGGHRAGDIAGHYKAYMPEGEEVVTEQEEEEELEATEDELGAEDEVADEEAAELEGDVTISDEEAQDIIDLAAKLETAVGGEEEELGGEEEFDELPVGIEAGGEEEEPMLQEGLYEAALQGLNINLVDDRAVRRQAAMQEVKKRIYERVVNRLINENQSARKRLPKRRRKR